jgi:hypothetical protein
MACGALERHDTSTINASVTDGSNHSWQLTAFEDHDFLVPVKATSTTLTIKTQFDVNYTGTVYPQVSILNGGGCGVADATQTGTIAGASAWETLTFSFTPTSAGVITLRLKSRTLGATGHCYFASVNY